MSARISIRHRIQRLLAYPRELRYWLRHPDQTLLRMEARWVLRWFTSSPGIFWVLAYLIVDFILLNREDLYLMLFGSEYPVGFPGISLYMILKAPFWLLFIRLRIGRFFQGARLEELAVTPCTGKMLWPALCIAPGLGVGILFWMDASLFYLNAELMAVGERSLELASRFSPSAVLDNMLGLLIFLPIVFIFMLLPSLAFTWCVTLHAVSKCVPDLNNIRLLINGAAASFIIFVPGMLPMSILMMIFLSVTAATGTTTTLDWIIPLSMFVLMPLNYIIAFFIGRRLTRTALLELRTNMIPAKLLRNRQGDHFTHVYERGIRTGELTPARNPPPLPPLAD